MSLGLIKILLQAERMKWNKYNSTNDFIGYLYVLYFSILTSTFNTYISILYLQMYLRCGKTKPYVHFTFVTLLHTKTIDCAQ